MISRGLAVLVLALASLGAACGSPEGSGDDAATPPGATTAASPADSEPPVPGEATAPRRTVTVLWPATDAAGLRAREAEVFNTRDPADLGRQIIGLLLGPAPETSVANPLPAGTKLLALFVDDRGIARVNLSREAASVPGGSTWEMLAVHAVVGSLIRSIPQVRRVQILVDGREIETLAGHLDLRGPLTLDETLILP